MQQRGLRDHGEVEVPARVLRGAVELVEKGNARRTWALRKSNRHSRRYRLHGHFRFRQVAAVAAVPASVPGFRPGRSRRPWLALQAGLAHKRERVRYGRSWRSVKPGPGDAARLAHSHVKECGGRLV